MKIEWPRHAVPAFTTPIQPIAYTKTMVTSHDSVKFSSTAPVSQTQWDTRATAFVKQHGETLLRLNENAGYAQYALFTAGGWMGKRIPWIEPNWIFQKRLAWLQGRLEKKANATQEVIIDYSANPKYFEEAKLLNAASLSDPLLQRQVKLLYLNFFTYNIDPALSKGISQRENELTSMYGKFRTRYADKEWTDGELEARLAESKDAKETEGLWKAKHQLGNYRTGEGEATLSQKAVELVKLRNTLAKKAGFGNFYQMGLYTQEIKEDQLVQLLGDVARATEPAFQAVRTRMDDVVKRRYGVGDAEVRRPWFQAGVNDPNIVSEVYNFSASDYLKGKNPSPLMKLMARLMGGNVDRIVDKSDLYPRPGKSQHWYLFNLKTPHDIRSIGNVDPKFQDNMEFTVSTLLHEVMGHGMGYSFISPTAPAMFRDLHTITTETDAMMMESQVFEADWLHRVLGMDKGKAAAIEAQAKPYKAAHKLMHTIRYRLLPIIEFEREMYMDPDQDLNKLWASKIKKYLGVETPGRNEPDWTYKIHLATAPVYYQNYFFADLARAQVQDHINTKLGGMLTPATGDYMRKHRADGRARTWDTIVHDMTGQPLNTKALETELAILTKP